VRKWFRPYNLYSRTSPYKWPSRTRQPASSASSFSPKIKLAHWFYKMQIADILVIAFIFSIIALIIHAVDTAFQWRMVQGRSKKYLWVRIPYLLAIFLGDFCLISYIEYERARERTTWLPALWALIGFSLHLSLSVEVRLSYHL
jgi:hypothetical protein